MIYKFFPFLLWFKDYKPEDLKYDLVAGFTVALVLVPQSMAYAQLAGLPAYYGLYAAFLPPMVAALFGSSRQLGTGPVAVVSLMSAASLEPLATAGTSEFIAYSIALALIVGIFQFSLGVLRLGMVVNFLSHPVINGFTNAAAIIIATSQFSKLLGVYVDKAPHHYETMLRVIQAAMDYTHMPTLLFGIGSLVIMIVLKHINPRIPNVLIVVAVAALLSWFVDFNQDVVVDVSNVRVVGLEEKISQYNNAVVLKKEHGDKRAELSIILDEMKKARIRGAAPSVEIARLKSEIYITSAQIEFTKEQISLARHNLRQLKFRVQQYDNQYIFHLLEETDKGDNHQVWRLKIGLHQLDPAGIMLRGGGAIVGSIPPGLPEIAVPEISFDTFFKLLSIAIIISMLGFMEAISIAKAMAAKTGQRLDPNQELIGQGLANILGSASSSYAVSGSFSRSAVNLQAGAVTGMSSVITSLVVVATLLFFTPLLYHLPQATLAAVIMVAVFGLINIRGFVHAWKAQWYDGVIAVITFIATLAFAPHLDKGIMVGIVLAMGVFLYKAMRPTVVDLAMDEDRVLKSAEHYHLRGCRHVAVIRFDGPLFYANASYLDEKVINFRSTRPDLRYILLDARGINDMDASGEEVLSMVVGRLRAAGIGFAMAGVKGQVLAVMERTHLLDNIGQEEIYPDTKSAVSALVAKIHFNTDLPTGGCGDCPLTHYLPASR